MGKESSLLMANYMMVPDKMTKCMDMVSSKMAKDINTKGNGLTMRNMGKELKP